MPFNKIYPIDKCQRCGATADLVRLPLEIWDCRTLCQRCYEFQRLARPDAARRYDESLAPKVPVPRKRMPPGFVKRHRKGPRRCPKCELIKGPKCFSKSVNRYCWCRQCCRENAAEWREHNRKPAPLPLGVGIERIPEPVKVTSAYLTKYGLTKDQYYKMHQDQDGGCAICKVKRKLFVDHCHSSGLVRGLLCVKCNMALGHFEDDLNRVEAAARYLLNNNLFVRAIRKIPIQLAQPAP